MKKMEKSLTNMTSRVITGDDFREDDVDGAENSLGD